MCPVCGSNSIIERHDGVSKTVYDECLDCGHIFNEADERE
jgi:predicted RNA-binding Zn-ribbon protein involved in translation (DUF1610 family)